MLRKSIFIQTRLATRLYATIKQVSNSIFTGGQLTEEELAKEIKEKGIKTVINIRSANENGYVDESKICEQQGVKYSHVPTSTNLKEWTKESGDRVVQELSNAPKPVLIHCAASNRAVTLGLLREVKDNGVDFEKEADRVGLTVEAFRKYANDVYLKK